MTDIHYDSLYIDTGSSSTFCRLESASVDDLGTYGRYGCDAPKPLVDVMMEDLQLYLSDHDDVTQVITLGDFPAHEYTNQSDWLHSFMNSTSFLFSAVDAVSDVPIFPTIGNDDCYPNYTIPAGSSDLLDIITLVFDNFFESDEEAEFFAEFGGLKRELSDTITLLSFNSIYYSPKHNSKKLHVLRGEKVEYEDDPAGQFAWLESEFQIAQEAGKSVWLATHIPPGVNAYDSRDQWVDQYTDSFLDILAQYPNLVTAFFSGHYHQVEYKFVAETPIFVCPGISACNGNNPGYSIFEYDDSTGLIVNQTVRFLDIRNANRDSDTSVSQLMSYSDAYPSTIDEGFISGLSLSELAEDIRTNVKIWEQYYDYQLLGYNPSRGQTACASVVSTETTYDQCDIAED
ncbi:hypothetical protein ADUPG1_008808 [Aduncisulcus paluster]|uniref:Calcineurin-like phosphoesterase domain-containing protein n=1 Tax=Aduncisulcus paluster TaxID=2918883 RepID=A0ABQ5KTB6_9EUKA|nr:hypothetical protein ADUPG1_008808 [Aduncisulcus paluster]